MSIPSPEAIEAAARVAEFVRQYRIRNDASPDGVIYNVWMDVNAEPAELRLDDLAALTPAAPVIAAQAKAEALREAADAADDPSPGEMDFYQIDQAQVGNWLRARADRLEGETK